MRVQYIFLAFIFAHLSKCSALNIAVIGAGPSGLVSAKHAIDQKHNVTVFEKTGTLGGIWYYTEQTNTDGYGVEIHSPMYRDLKTNIPVQFMAFPDLKYPNGTQSVIPHGVVFEYLQSYAREFHLNKLIRYHNLVDKVVFEKNGKWQVTVLRKNLPEDQQLERHEFDAVLVCSGINFEKRIPKITGAKDFKGKVLHSRAYRKPESFIGEDVLVIGRGNSGSDIARQLYNIDVKVTHSSYKPTSSAETHLEHEKIIKSKDFYNCRTPDTNSAAETSNVIRFIGKNRIAFDDGTCRNFSVVIYATGYKYSYPFLDESVGIHVHDSYVELLYMHVLNIKHPSMAFVGVAYGGAHFRLYDSQARFALKFISGDEPLPSKKEMLEYFREISHKRRPHFLGTSSETYMLNLAAIANIKYNVELKKIERTNSL